MFRVLTVAAVLAPLALATNPATCRESDGEFAMPFILRMAAHDDSPLNINVGVLPSVRQLGPDGHFDQVLLSQHLNGTALDYQFWQFDSCSNLKGHPYPPGYTPPDLPLRTSFGIIRPAGDYDRCLTLATPLYNTAGAHNNLLLAENCSAVDENYRTWYFEDEVYSETDYIKLLFANANDEARISNGPFGEVYYITDNKANDPQAMTLEFLKSF
jgi:hypothetical protein